MAGGDVSKLSAVKDLMWFEFYMHLQLLKERQAEEEERREKQRSRGHHG